MTSGDCYVRCSKRDCRKLHWGSYGAAGVLLLRRNTPNMKLTTQQQQILLQHRGYDSQSGGTWALPGGALDKGETPAEGALREAYEEVSLPDDCTMGDEPLVVLLDEVVTMDHGSWKYSTVIAEVRGHEWEPEIPEYDDESLALEWVAVDDVHKKLLHPGFKASWPELKSKIEKRREKTSSRSTKV